MTKRELPLERVEYLIQLVGLTPADVRAACKRTGFKPSWAAEQYLQQLEADDPISFEDGARGLGVSIWLALAVLVLVGLFSALIF